MFRSNRAYLLVAVLLLAITAFVAPRLLKTDDEEPIGEANGAIGSLTLQPGQLITQTFLGSPGTVTGILLSTPIYDNAPRVLLATLRDTKGILASSHSFSVTSKDDHSHIRIPLSAVHTKPRQKLSLTIQVIKGKPLQLLKGVENPYPYGELSGASHDDLLFSVLHQAPLSEVAKPGVITGLLVLAAMLLFVLIPEEWQATGALGLLIVIALIAMPSWWTSLGKWGVGDWDYRFSLDTIYRNTILQFHQFPLWNPYTCGGTASLADPEFSVLTPTFLLELILGVPMGVRVALYASLVIASTGVFILGRKLRLSVLGSFTAALIATYTSGYLLKAAEGHETIIFAYMWLPWALWAWLKAYRRESRPLWCGLFLGLIFLQGGIYMLSYLVAAFLLIIAFSSNKRRALVVTVQSGLWAMGAVAIKLIPVMLWLKQFPDRDYVPSTQTITHLVDIYLRRFTHGAWVLPNQVSGWHEYGAYIGYPVLAIALVGLSSYSTKRWVRGVTWGVVAAIAASSLGGILQPLFNHIPFIPRSNISRLALLAVFGISFLAGAGIDRLRALFGKRTLLVPLIIGIIAIDLLSLGSIIADQAFGVDPVTPPLAHAPWPLAFSGSSHAIDHAGKETNRDWANAQADYGTFSFCSVIGPAPGAVSPDAAYLTIDESGYAKVQTWSSTKVAVTYDTTTSTRISIATAYAQGWQANNQPAENNAGQVSTVVPAGHGTVVFRYRAPGFMLGVVITILTMILAFVVL